MRSACVVVSFFEGLSSPGAPIILPSPFFTDLPDQAINEAGAQTQGLEFFARYTPVRRWTVSVGMTELRGTSAPGTGFAAVADLCQFECSRFVKNRFGPGA
jgi:hypothetical protein